jgi:hypothetical protein
LKATLIERSLCLVVFSYQGDKDESFRTYYSQFSISIWARGNREYDRCAGASPPKNLTTCISSASGAIRALAKGTCTSKETKGAWVQLTGTRANSKVIFTCLNNKSGIRIIAQGNCDRSKYESKNTWVRATSSVDKSDTICASGGRCVVGDIGPGGGMVFYAGTKAQNWGRYLEAANPKTWQSSGVDPQYPWCQNTTLLIGATGTAIGTGASNTKKILVKCTDGAAVAAAAFRGGGKSDWFLPSKDELFQLYQELNVVFGFFPDVYWSSSEFDGISVWARQVTFGAQSNNSKDTPWYVRPIRAF